jgi:surface polysaccharide O-acyltransferase-like enzyme
LDTWKGVAILAAIGIHSVGSAIAFPSGSPNWVFGLLIRQPLNAAVPLFLALAGYFAGRASLQTAGDRRLFWRKRAVRILPPYVVWSLIYLALRSPEHLLDPLALAKDILLGSGIGIGYYVIVLIQCIAITPLLAHLKEDRHHIGVMISVTVVALAFRYFVALEHPDSLFAEMPYYALLFTAWYPFYHLGFWIRRATRPLSIRRSTLGGLAALFLLMSLAEGLILGSSGLPVFGTSQIKASSFLMSASLCALVLVSSGPRTKGVRLLAYMGRQSYFVYLSHVAVLSVFSSALQRSSMLYSRQPLFAAALWTMTVIACGLSPLVVQRVAPVRWLAEWLGMAPLTHASTQTARPVR